MKRDLAEARVAIEDTMEALIALLDAIDGDPDLEDGGDNEPSLAETGLLSLHATIPASLRHAMNCERDEAEREA